MRLLERVGSETGTGVKGLRAGTTPTIINIGRVCGKLSNQGHHSPPCMLAEQSHLQRFKQQTSPCLPEVWESQTDSGGSQIKGQQGRDRTRAEPVSPVILEQRSLAFSYKMNGSKRSEYFPSISHFFGL